MTKLFNENLGVAQNRIELSKLKKKFSNYDPSYVAVSTMATRPDFREWLQSIWTQYESFADTNFPNEFKKQFSQRAWELHLGTTLLNRGYTLASHSNSGPDFKIPYENKNIWIEAIAVEKGRGQDKVPEVEYGKAVDVPEKEMLLRLTAGLKEKYEKYLSYLKNNLVGQNDPFIIAIDRSALEHMDPQIPLILKCLFAVGHQVLFLKREKPRPKVEGSNWSAREKVNKISGSEVPMLMFRDASFEGVSAVIYSVHDILNSPRDHDKMGNGFVVVHNPFAKNPLSDDFFTFGDTWKQEGDQLKKIEHMDILDTDLFKKIMYFKFFMVIFVWGLIPLLIPVEFLPRLGLFLSSSQVILLRIWGVIVLADTLVYLYIYKRPHSELTKYLLVFSILDNGGIGTILLILTPILHLPWGVWINIPFQLFFGYWFVRFLKQGQFNKQTNYEKTISK